MSRALVRLIPLFFFFPLIVAAAVACQVGLVDAPDDPEGDAPTATSTPRDSEAVAASPTTGPAQPAASPAATSTPEVVAKPDRTTCAEIHGTQYHSAQEREWYLANCVPTPEPIPDVAAPSPPAIPGPEVTGERWILVDIGTQTTTAMIGTEPLYTAYVTTGTDGWETPTGNWNIVYRVENETMTSASIGAEEYYVLEDVLYTQYFTTVGHALHLNYWRTDDYFGNIRSSHGCVGMRLADAEFFWNFASYGTRVTVQ